MTPQQARQLQAAAKFLAAALRGDEAGALLLVEEHRDHTDPRRALLARLVQEPLVRLSHPAGLQGDTPAADAPAELDHLAEVSSASEARPACPMQATTPPSPQDRHQTPGEVSGRARESARPVEAVKRGMTAIGGQDERQAPASGRTDTERVSTPDRGPTIRGLVREARSDKRRGT